jgi:HD-like signal output (HDOD) protein/CheY-like chemotaxis protein
MKKRILFVDDETLVLDGLRRSLRPMRGEWEMDFSESGEAAKEQMTFAQYDVVVTDMLMRGIDGAELLQYVRDRSPRTIRLVLSGRWEEDFAMKCVGVAHRYLSKPCDASTLRSTVANLATLGSSELSDRIMELVAQSEKLPSVPSLYTRIVSLLRNGDTQMDEVGAIIASDPAMTAKILKVVNSSFFGLAHEISDPTEAVSHLGVSTLQALILATGVFSQFNVPVAGNFSVAASAERAQRVGSAARAIARAERAPKTLADDSLFAGMLHDIGKLILATNLPRDFEQIGARRGHAALTVEREVFGATHAEVGGYLLGLWGLPAQVVDAVNFHHTPSLSPEREFSPLTAIHIADSLIAGREDPASESTLDMEYLGALGLADHLPEWRSIIADL